MKIGWPLAGSVALLLLVGAPVASQPRGSVPTEEQIGRYQCIYVTPQIGGTIDAFLLDTWSGSIYEAKTREDGNQAAPILKSKPIRPEMMKPDTAKTETN